jgi:hypothetical protein
LSMKLTRRKFLKAIGASTAWIVLGSTAGCKPAERAQKNTPPKTFSPAQPKNDVWTFRSRPVFRPSTIEVATQAQETAPGYIFVAPKRGAVTPKWGLGQNGPMILNSAGQLVWFHPLLNRSKSATDFKVQHYQGQPVLTWWEGVLHGPDTGEYVILDTSYREISRVRAGFGYEGDMHEFVITPQGTALMTIYNRGVPADLSPAGGPKEGKTTEGVVQEVDIETGEVLFEWHSLDHIALDETYVGLDDSEKPHIDYFHLNSIDIDHDDNLLISAKKTFAVYKIDRKSGEVMWRLGGKKSDFEMGPGTRFRYQHNARRHGDGTITIFDNNGDPRLFNKGGEVDEQTRGIVLELDEDEMSVSLVREYTHPDKLQAALEGNVQVLPNGNVFIGWGSEPVFSEFNSHGEILFDANFTTKQQSYRAFRFPWSGHPSDRPAAVAERISEDDVRVYASWNGATELPNWEVLAGPQPNRLKPVKTVPRDDFETTIVVRTAESYVGIRAKDSSGHVLGSTLAIHIA